MFVGLAVLPLTGMVSTMDLAGGPWSHPALGVFFVVGGVLDHRLLCRVLAAPAVAEAPND
jgi:hypothetical protein